MNYLISLDIFPFQDGYSYAPVISGTWYLVTPTDFASVKEMVVYTADSEKYLYKMDSKTFSERWPMPSNQDTGMPTYYAIRVAEGQIWFNCPFDASYTIRMLFNKIPDDATDTTVSQLSELAKITIEKWGCADGFRMMGEHDRADRMEQEGNKSLAAMQRRYQLAMENDARIISFKEQYFKGSRY